MNNQQLQQFLAIKQEIAKLEKQLKPLKEAIEAKGSFETDQFKVVISTVEQNRVIGCDELLLKLGIVKVTELELIKQSSYNKVAVTRKEALVA